MIFSIMKRKGKKKQHKYKSINKNPRALKISINKKSHLIYLYTGEEFAFKLKHSLSTLQVK